VSGRVVDVNKATTLENILHRANLPAPFLAHEDVFAVGGDVTEAKRLYISGKELHMVPGGNDENQPAILEAILHWAELPARLLGLPDVLAVGG
jgi:hypothetical protein